jgi:hypothetical protein
VVDIGQSIHAAASQHEQTYFAGVRVGRAFIGRHEVERSHDIVPIPGMEAKYVEVAARRVAACDAQPSATTRRECNLEFQLVGHWHAPGSLTRCGLQTDIAKADHFVRTAQMTVFAQPLDTGSPDREPLGLQRTQAKRQHRHQSLADHMFE